MTDRTMEERLQRLEDLDSVREVMSRYFDYIDMGYDLDGLRTLFTEDAVWDSNIARTLVSREEFLEFQSQNTDDIKWAFHMLAPLWLNVSPDTRQATGRWQVIGLHTMVRPTDRSATDAVFYTARYDCEFVVDDGSWKIKVMKLHIHQLSSLAKGWVEEPFYWSRLEE